MVGHSPKHSLWWTIIISLLVISFGIALGFYVHQSTTKIRNALAAEALEQQADVASLIHDYSGVMLAVERAIPSQNSDKFTDVYQATGVANLQLNKMRSEYSFERLDGAAAAHAYAKPVLEDVSTWLVHGIPGRTVDDNKLLSIASTRLDERYDELRKIEAETNAVATSLIATQTNFLDRFRSSLILLLAAYSMLALSIAALLIRQRNLQSSLANEQERNAQRFSDFADVGADWFWETDAQLQFLPTVDKPTMVDWVDDSVQLDSSPDKKSDDESGWPLDSMIAKDRFAGVEKRWIMGSSGQRVISISGKPLIDSGGNFQGYRGVGRDITERKKIEKELQLANVSLIEAETRGREQAEEALRSSEELLRTTLDSLPSEIAILDRYGQIIAANNAWRNFTSQSDLGTDGGVGMHYLDVYGAVFPNEREQIDALGKDIDEVLSGQVGQLNHEYRYHNEDQEFWVVIGLLTFDSGDNRYAVLVRQDVTDQRQLEARDRRLRAELAHSSRLTSVGEMASGLAHELNQPLTAITHNCDALLSGMEELAGEKSEVAQTTQDIYMQAQRAGGIIRSLRQLMRKDTDYTPNVDLNKLVEETVRLTHPEARERGVNVNLHFSDNLPKLTIDPVQIQQVLVNLERNGVEAMSNADCHPKELVISTNLDANDVVRISVKDSGPGFSDDMRANLFTAFQSTKADGMGLGLSISRSIVESHGGRLWLDTESDGGANFHFTLPVRRE